MTVYFAKSLDRPIDIFGLRGKWLVIFLVAAGVSVVLAVIVGSMTSAGLGTALALILAAGSFLGCLVLQGKIPSRQLEKFKVMNRLPSYVSRRETLSRILMQDPRYQESLSSKQSKGHDR